MPYQNRCWPCHGRECGDENSTCLLLPGQLSTSSFESSDLKFLCISISLFSSFNLAYSFMLASSDRFAREERVLLEPSDAEPSPECHEVVSDLSLDNKEPKSRPCRSKNAGKESKHEQTRPMLTSITLKPRLSKMSVFQPSQKLTPRC